MLDARQQTARAVNSTLVMMYWQIGQRIRQDVLGNERAEYGKEIVATVSRQLTEEYGKGFDKRNLHYMMRFAEHFPDEQIVNALRSQLSWTHFRELISIGDRLKREFYAEMCRVERWSTRTLRHKIGHLLYERTAVAKKPDELIEQDITTLRDEDRLTPDMIFRDPYVLDFLGPQIVAETCDWPSGESLLGGKDNLPQLVSILTWTMNTEQANHLKLLAKHRFEATKDRQQYEDGIAAIELVAELATYTPVPKRGVDKV